MGKGFVPEGDKLHSMQPQRPGTFIAVTEKGVVLEVLVVMDSQSYMAREWTCEDWDQAKADAETKRVTDELMKAQAAQQGQRQQQAQRPAQGQVIRPAGLVPGTI